MRSSRALVCLAGMAAVGTTAAASDAPLPTTPPGVTLVEVVRELPISQPQILWVRPGDQDGRTLLVFERDEPGVSHCVAECAAEFPPLLAAQGAEAFGDWSLVRRDDGGVQWAYQSQPLYTWMKEELPGELATNVGLTETADSIFAETAVEAGDLVPPEGWEVARFTPAASIEKRPDSVDVRLVNAIQAVTLTHADGRTLYVFDGDAQQDNQECVVASCDASWVPLAAPAIAKAIGDFSVATRSDGSKQWAYRGQALYTYSGDRLPGDALGLGVDERWNPAVVTKNFQPENVGITVFEGYGAALTVNGMTLYGGYPFEKRWGGRNLRDTFTYAYYQGKKLGAAACADEACLETWRPFEAPGNAQPNGFWEPIERDDGTKQWAYKGFGLYTYAGDRAPGEHYGQATYAFEFQGEDIDLERIAFLHSITGATAGVGIYWNIAKP